MADTFQMSRIIVIKLQLPPVLNGIGFSLRWLSSSAMRLCWRDTLPLLHRCRCSADCTRRVLPVKPHIDPSWWCSPMYRDWCCWGRVADYRTVDWKLWGSKVVGVRTCVALFHSFSLWHFVLEAVCMVQLNSDLPYICRHGYTSLVIVEWLQTQLFYEFRQLAAESDVDMTPWSWRPWEVV